VPAMASVQLEELLKAAFTEQATMLRSALHEIAFVQLAS
jgi:hypothetical protein